MLLGGRFGSKAASEAYSSPAAAFGGIPATRHSTPGTALGQKQPLQLIVRLFSDLIDQYYE
jgi:hypothetical protein